MCVHYARPCIDENKKKSPDLLFKLSCVMHLQDSLRKHFGYWII